jgi:hypothetical protein
MLLRRPKPPIKGGSVPEEEDDDDNILYTSILHYLIREF